MPLPGPGGREAGRPARTLWCRTDKRYELPLLYVTAGDGQAFLTIRVSDPDLTRDLDRARANTTGTRESTWLRDLAASWLLPLPLLLLIWPFAAAPLPSPGFAPARGYAEETATAVDREVIEGEELWALLPAAPVSAPGVPLSLPLWLGAFGCSGVSASGGFREPLNVRIRQRRKLPNALCERARAAAIARAAVPLIAGAAGAVGQGSAGGGERASA